MTGLHLEELLYRLRDGLLHCCQDKICIKLYLVHMSSVCFHYQVTREVSFLRVSSTLQFQICVKHSAKLRHFMPLLFFLASKAKAVMVFTSFYHHNVIMYKVFTSFFFKGILSLIGSVLCS